MPEQDVLPLRDIHLPASLAWWPPAPGWWLVAGMLMLLVVLGVWYVLRRKRRRIHRVARQGLAAIQARYLEQPDDQQMLAELSVWLRRVCLSVYPRAEVAGLTGEAWLRFLDQAISGSSQAGGFSQGAGRVLISAPYQAAAVLDAPALFALCEQWLRRLPASPRESV